LRFDVIDEPVLTLALPVKDGGEWLPHTLDEIDEFLSQYDHSCEVIVVDDGSTDGTAEILRDRATQRSGLRVLTHTANRGKGAALVTAITASAGKYVFTMDSDATYSVRDLPRFLDRLQEGNDAVFGNRRDAETRFVLHPIHFPYIGLRHALGWLFALAVRWVVGGQVADPQCGFKAYRGDVIRRIAPLIREQHFAFDSEVLSLLGVFGSQIAEVPVLYVYRQQHSSVRLVRDGLRMAVALFRIRSRARRRLRTGEL
jgi:dolichyl-phosphate beta-glucosyltransferase